MPRRATSTAIAAGSSPSAPGAMAGLGGVALLPWQDIPGMIWAMCPTPCRDPMTAPVTRDPAALSRARSSVWRGGVGLVLVALAAGLLLGGCASDPTIGSGPIYPAVEQSRVLDVQVKRAGTRISFTNAAAEPIGPGRLWANKWFSREIDAIAPGQTVSFDLSEFKDRYGDSFRAGGFFATQLPSKLVLMQLEREGTLVGLIVIGDGAAG